MKLKPDEHTHFCTHCPSVYVCHESSKTCIRDEGFECLECCRKWIRAKRPDLFVGENALPQIGRTYEIPRAKGRKSKQGTRQNDLFQN